LCITGIPTSTKIFLQTKLERSSPTTYKIMILNYSTVRFNYISSKLEYILIFYNYLPTVEKSISFIEMIFTAVTGDFQFRASSIAVKIPILNCIVYPIGQRYVKQKYLAP